MTFLSVVWIAVAAFTISAQLPADLDSLGERVRYGDDDVKRDALQAIARIKSEEASRLAIPALTDPSELVRATAVGAIVSLPPREVYELLLPLLSAREDFVRRETAYALGDIEYEKVADTLVATYNKNSDREYKAAVLEAVGKTGNTSHFQFLNGVLSKKPQDKDAFIRRSAARAIGRIAERANGLAPLKTTPENFLASKYKSTATPIFANVGSMESLLKTLSKILENRKESPDTVREAAFALGAIGDPSAASILDRCSESTEIYLSEICREARMRIPPTD